MSTVKGRARPVDHPKWWWRWKSWCELEENGVPTVLECGEGAVEVGGDATKPELVAPRRKEVLTTARSELGDSSGGERESVTTGARFGSSVDSKWRKWERGLWKGFI